MRIPLALLALTLAAAPVVVAQPQPIDTSVQQVFDRRSHGFFADCTITLELPKIKSSEVEASRVVVQKATDDTGLDLVNREKQEQQTDLEPNFRGSMMRGEDPPATVGVTLKNPARTATKITEVRGEIELFMPSKDPNSIAEIPKFLTFTGKPLTHKALKANGIEIALLNAAQIETEKKRRAEAKKKEYAELGYSGEDLASVVTGFLESLFGLDETEHLARIKDPNKRIQQISFVDATGEVKPVMVRDEEGLVHLSTWAKPEADWKMRVSMKTPKNVVRYAFAVKDVPLP